MNERLQKLAEEADLNATLQFNKHKLEKFAELIIKECTGLCEQAEMQNAELGKLLTDLTDKFILAGSENQAAKLVVKIKTHFGVNK
jgi:hypothetical protein